MLTWLPCLVPPRDPSPRALYYSLTPPRDPSPMFLRGRPWKYHSRGPRLLWARPQGHFTTRSPGSPARSRLGTHPQGPFTTRSPGSPAQSRLGTRTLVSLRRSLCSLPLPPCFIRQTQARAELHPELHPTRSTPPSTIESSSPGPRTGPSRPALEVSLPGPPTPVARPQGPFLLAHLAPLPSPAEGPIPNIPLTLALVTSSKPTVYHLIKLPPHCSFEGGPGLLWPIPKAPLHFAHLTPLPSPA